MHWKGGRYPPPLFQGAEPLSPWRQVPASIAFVTENNGPQPLWQPSPTAHLTASGAASEVRSLLMCCPSFSLYNNSGRRPIGAARFRQQSAQAPCQPPCPCQVALGIPSRRDPFSHGLPWQGTRVSLGVSLVQCATHQNSLPRTPRRKFELSGLRSPSISRPGKFELSTGGSTVGSRPRKKSELRPSFTPKRY